MNLSGSRRKFCEGVVSGLTFAAEYREAYPESEPENAHKNARRLTGNDDIQAEVARLRLLADDNAGPAVMDLIEKRKFLARIVRAQVSLLPADSDLWNSIKLTPSGTEFRMADKLLAIRLDNDLSGQGCTAEGDDALAGLISRIAQ